jgi:O-antigen/teichoic acid export membrane protein
MSLLSKLLRQTPPQRGGFVHAVGALAGGTAFAQVVSALALPLLTRLYTPQEFNVLAVYASILAILSVAACLRFEIAIPMPQKDEEAADLLALSLISASIFSALIGAAALLAPGWIANHLGSPAIAPYLWLVPVGVWLSGVYSAVQYWSTRKRKFSSIARTRMAQAVGGSGAQLALGVAGAGPFGLLVGQVISNGAGVYRLSVEAWCESRDSIRQVSWSTMRRAAKAYSRFPKYSTPDALANSLGIQAPIIIIAALAVGPEAGFLMLAIKVMAIPMKLVGGAIAQAYLAHASDEMRAGNLGGFTSKILGGLTKAGVGPLIFAGFVAPQMFAIIFGDEWRRAGELVAWMTPWFVLQFISSPVSMVMHVTNQQRAMLALTTSGLVVRLGTMIGAYFFARSYFSELYACSGAIFYFVCCVVFYNAAGVRFKQAAHTVFKSALPVLLWVAAGLTLNLVIKGVS